MSESGEQDYKELVKELQDFKRLTILAMLKFGFTQAEIAAALDVNQSTVSRMFPSGSVKKSE